MVNKKNRKNLLLALFIGALLLAGCGKAAPEAEKAALLGIDVSAAEILSQEDSHGGFHGDGITWIRFACEGTDIARQIAEKENWAPFPLNDTVKALVYGIEEGTAQIGPYLLDEDGGPLIPEIENGYYLLIDRQAEEGKASGVDILHRASLNFILGIYDSDTDMLYYAEMDT